MVDAFGSYLGPLRPGRPQRLGRHKRKTRPILKPGPNHPRVIAAQMLVLEHLPELIGLLTREVRQFESKINPALRKGVDSYLGAAYLIWIDRAIRFNAMVESRVHPLPNVSKFLHHFILWRVTSREKSTNRLLKFLFESSFSRPSDIRNSRLFVEQHREKLPPAQVTERELIDIMQGAMEILPPEVSEVLNLYFFHDVPLCEIPARVGITTFEGARLRLKQGIAMLREMIEHPDRIRLKGRFGKRGRCVIKLRKTGDE